jgi:hypothetical protein
VGEDFYRGNKWPPADLVWANPGQPPVPWHDANPARYPRSAWTSHYLSLSVLGEFATTGWSAFQLPDWRANAVPVADELYELYQLIDYRPGVMAEAVAEIQGIQTYWQGLLMCSQRSHPRTLDLMFIAIRVGEFLAMYYKHHLGNDNDGNPIPDRPRPSQLSPALLPPIAVPGHASYPSGHSTQSHLLSYLLASIPAPFPAALTTPLPINSNPAQPAASLLDRLAERVSRNREVLGLHYPSDTAAGRLLATNNLPRLLACPTVHALLPLAAQEWQ